MQYFNSQDTTHEIEFLPRYFESSVTVKIHYELNNEDTTITPVTATELNEYMSVSFDYEFIKNASYQIEVVGSDGLIFRCKAKGI